MSGPFNPIRDRPCQDRLVTETNEDQTTPDIRQAKAAFDFDSWDETPVLDVDGASITRTTFVKRLTGDLAGVSHGELVMAGAGEASKAYSGVERFDGSLEGRPGTFILRHHAWMAGGSGALDVVVMADSGTGDLAGISGTASISQDDEGRHSLTLDYQLPN
jgi:hypothetical protein